MTEKIFFDRLINILENLKNDYDLDNIHDSLILWFSENYLNLDPQETVDRIVTDKRAEGVDSVLIDQTNYELIFIQAKSVNCFENTLNHFKENDIKLTLSGITYLLKSNYTGKITPELENLINEYHELEQSAEYKTVIIFLTLKKPPNDNKFIEDFIRSFPQIEIRFLDFKWLYDFFINQYLLKRASPPEKISFKILSNLLEKSEPQKARVFTCKGEELAKIYHDHKEKIFQQNVRYSLGLKSKSINRLILDTAKNDDRSKNFWYFNNGITIVCDKIIESTSGRVINLLSAQIINGAQSTYALHEAYLNDTLKDDVEVLIKAIESEDKSFIDNVTLYTNSQNAIRLRDLSSNDEIQDKIQKIILKIYRYFYERKRGEFNSLYPTPGAKKDILGKYYNNKIISNENAAQAYLSFYLNKPAQAKSEKGRIFMKDTAGFYDSIFDKYDEFLPEKILLSWKLLKYIEILKKEYRKEYKSAENKSISLKRNIYKYDFLLHSEYFILNLFKDFLKKRKYNIFNNKEHIITITSKIDSNSKQIKIIYNKILELFANYFKNLKTEPWYYHNKFFKNENSIVNLRNSLNKKEDFIEVI